MLFETGNISVQPSNVPTSAPALSDTFNVHVPFTEPVSRLKGSSGKNVPVNGATPALIDVDADAEKRVLIKFSPPPPAWFESSMNDPLGAVSFKIISSSNVCARRSILTETSEAFTTGPATRMVELTPAGELSGMARGVVLLCERIKEKAVAVLFKPVLCPEHILVSREALTAGVWLSLNTAGMSLLKVYPSPATEADALKV